MTATRIAGFVLIVLGLVGVLWGGISWTKEKIPFPPVAGAVALVAGVVLLVLPARRKS